MKCLGKVSAVAVVALIGAGALLSHSIAAESSGKAEVGKAAPDFKLKDIYGKEFSLAEFKEKVVVLEWFNEGCPVIKQAHKRGTMQDTYREFVDKGVVWLAIDSTDGASAESDRVHAAKYGLAFPILMDADGKVARAYGAQTTPHMFIVDKGGMLAYTGAIDDKGDTNYVSKALSELLGDQKVSVSKTKPYGCGVKLAARSGG